MQRWPPSPFSTCAGTPSGKTRRFSVIHKPILPLKSELFTFLSKFSSIFTGLQKPEVGNIFRPSNFDNQDSGDKRMEWNKEKGSPDMIKLDEYTIPALMKNLLERYDAERYYVIPSFSSLSPRIAVSAFLNPMALPYYALEFPYGAVY